MKLRRFIYVLWLPVMGLVSWWAWAQNRDVQERREPLFKREGKKDEDPNSRAVGGVVRDEKDEPVEGAVVQLKDLRSLRIRSYITKGDGMYRFYGLSTNSDYELRAQFRDSESELKKLSIFDSRKQAVINLKLQARSKEEPPKETPPN